MDEKCLKIARVGALCMLALSAVSYTYYFGRSVKEIFPNKTFAVDGMGEAETAPDVATFSVSVLSDGGKNVSAVQQVNTDKMNKVTAFIKGQGVEAKDIKTVEYNLNPRYSSDPCNLGFCPPATIIGYSLTQTLAVKVRDTEKLGGLLSGVVDNGANTVFQVQFVLDDDNTARAAARALAIGKAKEEALQIAKTAGFTLGKLLSVSDSTRTPSYYGDSNASLGVSASMKAAEAPTPQPGVTTTKVQMTLTYEIIN